MTNTQHTHTQLRTFFFLTPGSKYLPGLLNGTAMYYSYTNSHLRHNSFTPIRELSHCMSYLITTCLINQISLKTGFYFYNFNCRLMSNFGLFSSITSQPNPNTRMQIIQCCSAELVKPRHRFLCNSCYQFQINIFKGELILIFYCIYYHSGC